MTTQSPKRSLQQVCEQLQQQLVSVARDRHCEVAERFLEWFGWEDPAPLAFPGDLVHMPSVSYLLSCRGQGVLAAHFVLPGALRPPSSVIQRGLDFCECTRTFVRATRAIKVRYAFVTDLQRAYLYETNTEELLLSADSPVELEREFRNVLDKPSVVEGSLDEARRHPRSHLARQLREWRSSWSELLINQWQVPEPEAFLVLDRLVLLRALAERYVMLRIGKQISVELDDLMSEAQSSEKPVGLGRDLLRLVRDVWHEGDIELCALQPHADTALERDELAVPLLRELGLISRAKFQLATVLESFNYGDAAEKARVRMIPEENEERLSALAAQTVRTVDDFQIEVDLAEEGYRAVLYWFDQLTALYDRLEREYDNQQVPPALETKSDDLFQWSAAETNRPAALRDTFQHALEKGLIVYCATPHQMRVAKLSLYLHIIERCASSRRRLSRFPHVERCLRKRPTMLETDRKMIFQGGVQEWEVI